MNQILRINGGKLSLYTRLELIAVSVRREPEPSDEAPWAEMGFKHISDAAAFSRMSLQKRRASWTIVRVSLGLVHNVDPQVAVAF